MIGLKGITWDHPRGYQPLAASSRLYRERHGVQVVWEARSLKDFGDASLDELSLEYDLIVMDHPHVGEAARADCLIPFDELCDGRELARLEAQSAGPSYASYRYGARQWALPLDAACQVASYRPDYLEPGRLPSTWEQALELARRLRLEGLWMAMPLCPTDSLCSFLTLSAQFGDGPREVKKWIHRKTTIAVLERLRALRDACHPSSLDWNPIDLYDAMAAGDRIACCPLAFGYINYTREGFRAHPIAFGGIPGKTGALLGGAGIAVSRRAADATAAARYVLWLCGSAFQSTTFLEAGGQPGNGLAWQAASADAATRDFLLNTRQALESAYVRPRFPGWPAFQEELGNRVHAFLKADSHPDRLHDELESLFMQSRAQ